MRSIGTAPSVLCRNFNWLNWQLKFCLAFMAKKMKKLSSSIFPQRLLITEITLAITTVRAVQYRTSRLTRSQCRQIISEPDGRGLVQKTHHSSCPRLCFPTSKRKISREQIATQPLSHGARPVHPHQSRGSVGAVGSPPGPSHQHCAHSKSWLLSWAPALPRKEKKEHVALPFHGEPKLAQHIIWRLNVYCHRIHPSSSGGALFASLTCVGKGAAKSLLSESTFPWRSKVYSLVFKSSLFILTVPIYGKKMAKR